MSIVIENLSYTYPGGGVEKHRAIHDISMEITEGEFIGVIGHTGCGKSTFLQHLNGLILPTSGTVTVDGMTYTDKKQRAKTRSLVGMVFQYPEYQLFAETVADDVAFGPRNMKLSEEEVRERVKTAMTLVGLDPKVFSVKSPFELSGGEKRRAALAGVIAMQPKYLVLDEPMAGLDPKGRKDILTMLDGLRERWSCTIIMVSHSMDDVARYATRVIAMSEGTVVCSGTPAEVFARSEKLDAMGLSLPQAAKLALILRKNGIDVPHEICTTEAMLKWLEGRLVHD